MRPRWGHRSIISDHFCNRILCESMSRRLRAAPRSPFCCARAAAIQCLLHEAAAPHCAPSPPCQRSKSQRRPQSGYLGPGCDAGAASPPSHTTQQARCSVSEAAHEDQHGQLQPQHSNRWSSGTIVGSVALGRHNTTGGTIATKRGRSLSTPFSHSATRAHVAAQSTASASIPALGTEPQPPRRDRVGVHTKTQQMPSPASHSAQLSQRSAHACAGGTAAVPHRTWPNLRSQTCSHGGCGRHLLHQPHRRCRCHGHRSCSCSCNARRGCRRRSRSQHGHCHRWRSGCCLHCSQSSARLQSWSPT